MKWNDFYELAQKGIAFSDGAMGTLLQIKGLTGDECPELWNVDRPDDVIAVHRAYIDAGSNMLTTNTFGGNRLKLSNYKLENRLEEINAAAIRNAKKAAGDKAIVTASIGPTGKFIAPVGKMTFDEMVDIYKEQILAVANAGADALNFETHVDILELKAAIVAAREVCDLPILANLTFEKDGRTVTGTPPDAAFTLLEALGVDVIGTNCSTGPENMALLMGAIRGLFAVPMICQANAGMPKIVGGKTVFDESPESFSEKASEIVRIGANIVGGCCGTTPEHIRCLKEKTLQQKIYQDRKDITVDYLKLSSRYAMRKIGFDLPFCIIGERLNPTARKKLAADIQSGEFQMFKEEALNQERCGADVLDLNMGIPGADEAELIRKGIELLSTSVQSPLAIDSANNDAARLGLRIYPGKPILNSISAEADRMKLLKDVKKYGAAFIALPIDENGIPETAEGRIRLMKKIIAAAEKEGIDKKNILADPLAMTVSANQNAAKTTLETIRRYKNELGLFSTIGLSNISFGLPLREFVNRSFLASAINEGLTTAIMNPLDEEIVGTAKATDVLLGKDLQSKEYIRLYAGRKLDGGKLSLTETAQVSDVKKPDDKPMTLEQRLGNCVIQGNKSAILPLLEEALSKGMKAVEILNDTLIPAIQQVGEFYEKKIFFLPQLMLSAETMKSAFVRLEPLLKENASKPRGKVLIATVKGDVHDIGKNIVVIMLQNYGFDVIDLGKDISGEEILLKAKEYKVDIIGLSALMTTTMPRMDEFVRLLESNKLAIPVMIGGAAVTDEYAKQIGAYYAQDAVGAVKLANSLIKQ